MFAALRKFFLSYKSRAALADYQQKINLQHEIADRVSFMVAGHLILADRSAWLEDNETVRLANAAICSLYLLNDLVDYGDAAAIFDYIGDDRYKTYTVPGYDPFILYREHINYNLITGQPMGAAINKRPPHVFDPVQWYTTYEIVLLATADIAAIEREVQMLIFGPKYKKQIVQIAQFIWRAGQS
jgi:hypothetical protein